MNESKRIMIASGGTGGHIFPAIVFGRELEKDGAKVSWLCGSRPLEREIYNASGIEPVILPLEGSPMGTRSVMKIFSRIADVIRSLRFTSRIVNQFKPSEVYVFGGYISFAPMIVSLIKRIPVTLHEQNTVAGRVARLASRLGVKIITGWPVCEGIKNFTYTGIPVRDPVRIPRHEALKRLGLENINVNAKIVCVAGGSLGSGPLRDLLTKTAAMCEECEFIFLSSNEKCDEGNAHYILPHWDTNPFYSVCDVLVCRSGGSTLAEALKWGMKTITIPWPGAMDNHQYKNACEFVKLSENAHIFSENDSPENLSRLIKNVLQ